MYEGTVRLKNHIRYLIEVSSLRVDSVDLIINYKIQDLELHQFEKLKKPFYDRLKAMKIQIQCISMLNSILFLYRFRKFIVLFVVFK